MILKVHLFHTDCHTSQNFSTVITDQFESQIFVDFAAVDGFRYSCSSQQFIQSNEEAKCHGETVKHMLILAGPAGL